jgi:hypothetical protein
MLVIDSAKGQTDRQTDTHIPGTLTVFQNASEERTRGIS